MAKKKTSSKTRLPPIEIPLSEPLIAGDTEGAHGGLGRRHTERDLVVYLRNPKDGVAAGSVASLFWGNRNVPVASTIIREGEEDLDRIPLTVPASRIVEFWANPVFGKLRRSSGNESLTEELKLRVRLNRPGGFDPDVEKEGHQGLVYVVPPEVLLSGVSEAAALAGVRIIIRHWLYMRAYDLIVLVWGSQRVEHRVQPDEVDRDITLVVDYATISAAGNSPLTRVAYQVRDAGGNLPDERARWSASTFIDVHLNEVRPEAPWLAFPDTGSVIDLADLHTSDVELQSWITGGEVSAYSHVTLIWAGTDNEGNSVPHTETKALDKPGVYKFYILNALVAAIADGTASAQLLFQRGTFELPSQKLYLEIIGELVRWPAPTIDEDQGGHVESDVAATVRFPLQDSWPAKGYLEVIFRVSNPDNTIEHRVGREVDDVEPTPGRDLLFTVYPEELARFEGHLVEVFYALTRPRGLPQESLRLQVIVGRLQRTMPAPIIEKAISHQLNPDDIGPHARVFAPFTDTKRADWIRMYWIGDLARTEVAVQVPVDGATTEHYIDAFYVNNNLNSSVTVFYTLRRGEESPRYSLITEVLISRDVGDLPVPELLAAEITGPDTAELDPLNVQSGTKLVVSYVGMRNQDSIKVSMIGAGNGGSPDIAAKPGNQALEKVEFDITPAAIHANIRDVATTVKFTYVVTRNGVSKTSEVLTVTVKPLSLAELAKTVLQINQANAATKVLDLTTFIGNATSLVGVWPFITSGYPVWLRLLGKTSANVVHDHVVYNGAGGAVVNDNWISTGKIEASIPRSYLDGLGHGTTLTMEFKAAVSTSTTEAQAISFPAMVYSVNALPVEFPFPQLNQANGTGNTVTLAPLNAQNGATVSVEFTPMYATDSIRMFMAGAAGPGSPAIPAKPGVTGGLVTFDIPKAAIAANIGNANKTFTLKYEVTRGGVVHPSQVLTVTVTPIPVTELRKTLIQLNEADQSTKLANMLALTNGGNIRLGTWPFIALGQRVWLTLTGKGPKGETYNLTLLNGSTGSAVNNTWLSQGYFQPNTVSYRNYLRQLGGGTELKIQLKVTLNESTIESEAIMFPESIYVISMLDRTCLEVGAGHFARALPGGYFFCELKGGGWGKTLKSCPVGQDFNDIQQRCLPPSSRNSEES